MGRKKRNQGPAKQSAVSPVPLNDAKSADSIWRRNLLAAAALGFITFLAYSNSFHAGFALDNDPLILQDARLRDATIENVSLIANHPYWVLPPEKGLYRPFTTLTYLFNYAVLGNAGQPEGYHIINFILHLANLLLLFGLALFFLRNFWPAFFIAAVWAVHPVLTESVTNIIGRADLLAALGTLSAFWMYLKSAESNGRARIAWLAGLFISTAVAVYSKESAVAILPIIIAYEITWWRERKQLRGLLFGCVAVMLPIIAMLLSRAIVLARSTAPVFPYVDNPLLGASFLTARLTAIKVMGNYLWLLIWPAKLSWNYYYSQIPLARGTFYDWLAWLSIVAAIGASAAIFRRNRVAFFFASFAFITLIPVSNLFLLIGTIMAERFLYLPSIGFAVCVVLAVYALATRTGKPALAPVALCLIIAAFGLRTLARNSDWKDNMTLLTAGVSAAPNSFASHFALGTELYLADAAHSNLYRAIDEAEKSLAILDPLPDTLNFADAYANAGTYYERKGDQLARMGPDGKTNASPESIRAYQRSLQILLRGEAIDKLYDQKNRERERARGRSDSEISAVGSLSLYQELAFTYLRLGENQKAYDAVIHARLLNPDRHETYLLLAQILFAANRMEEGAVALVEAYLISNDATILGQLAQLYQGGLDPKGCAITQGPGGPTLNTSCEAVQTHICRAISELNGIFLQANRPELAASLKSRAAREFTCPR